MKLLVKFAIATLCIFVAGFCAFGFLASFEPGVQGAMFFRVAYGAVGLGCVGAIVSLAAGAFHSGSK